MGTVYLVGGGPGDPGLLTLRGARLLRRADVVVHDALISEAVLERVPASAERIDVGKRCGGRHTPQLAIHRILVDAARRARIVVRLKGGDPFVFGRGGEEALALREAGIPFEVVPGVTAALGAAAYAGIPLTHRGVSASVRLVTGHECARPGEERVDWEELARSRETLAIYMGVKSLPEIADRLIRHGRSVLTPAAVIEWGTHARQRTVEGPLLTIAERAREAGVGAPALVVVGEVAALGRELAWFERRPLHGLRVLLPGSGAAGSRLSRALRAEGAEVVTPRTAVRPPRHPAPLRHALAAAGSWEWVLFTSPHAVAGFWGEARARGVDARAFAGLRFATVGAATARALARRGLVADARGVGSTVAAVATSLAGELGGARVLFPSRGGAGSALAAHLAERGAAVHPVEAYREEPAPGAARELREALASGGIDAVALASSAAVRRFAAALGADPAGAPVAVLGAEAAETAHSLGLPVHIVSAGSTFQESLRGLRDHARTRRTHAPEKAGSPPGGARLAPQR